MQSLFNSEENKSQSHQIAVPFWPNQIEFLIRCLEFDIDHAEEFYTQRKNAFEKFRSRYLDYSQRQLPSGKSLISEFEEESKNWEIVRLAYRGVIEILRKGLEEVRNVA